MTAIASCIWPVPSCGASFRVSSCTIIKKKASVKTVRPRHLRAKSSPPLQRRWFWPSNSNPLDLA
jgi:hypothetical protein